MQKAARNSDSGGRGDEMDLDVDEAREVARKIMAGSASPRGGKPQNQRRGLGVDKQKGSSSGGRQGGGSGSGRGGKNFRGKGNGGRIMKKGSPIFETS